MTQVVQASQTISFTAPASPVVYGVAPITLSATASSGLSVTFSIVSGPGSISGNTLTITGAGTVVVGANQAGNANYAAATQVTRSVVVNAATPTLNVATSGTPSTYSNSVTFTATISSGPNGTITFYDGGSSIGTGTISGPTAMFTTSALAGGSHAITANWAGNTNYGAVTSSAITQTVNQASQTISFTAPTSPVTYGVSPLALAATASSGLAVTFSIVSGPGTISGSTLTITGVGTVVVAANQAGNANYSAATQVTRSVVVNAAQQTISFTALSSPVNYGVSPIALSATGGGSGNAVTFSIVSGPGSISGGMLTIVGAGTVVVAANQAGNANYTAAPQVTQSVVVNDGTQTINFTAPSSPVNYGVSPIALSATGGGSGNAVTFSIVSGPGSVTGSTLTVTGIGTVVIAANQLGNADYTAAAQVTQSVVVNQGSQTISFTAPSSPVTYGVPPIALSATGGGSGNAVTFSVVSGPGIISGSTLTIIGAGTVVVAANETGNANYSAAPQVTQSVVVNDGSQTISFTAPPSPVFNGVSPIALSATGGGSGSAVVFSILSGPGTIGGSTLTITGVGTVVVAANQDGNANYTPAPQVTQSVVVFPTPPAISGLTPSSGLAGILVTITGANFGLTQGSVTINGLDAAIAAWNTNSITAWIPTGIPSNELVPVVVSAGTESSAPVGFMVTSQSSGPPPCQ